MKRTPRIGGEDAAAVGRALVTLLEWEDRHGPFLPRLGDWPRPMPPARTGPLFRAVLRTQAQLLLDDAVVYPRSPASRRDSLDRDAVAWTQVLRKLGALGLLPATAGDAAEPGTRLIDPGGCRTLPFVSATAPVTGPRPAEDPAAPEPAVPADGRRRRFEELFAAHASAVYGYARRRTTPADAEEVVADTFLVAWRRLDAVPAPALPWLLAVARRTLANRDRGDARRVALQLRLATTADDQPPAPGEAPNAAIQAALATLPPGEHEVLTLLAWDGLSPAEIAAVVGCTRAAVYLRLSRARRRMRTALAEENPS